MNAPLLEVELTAGYGAATTLHEVCLSLQVEECAGVVGTSGAGKSTLVLALLGLLPWRGGWARGRILFQGRDLLRMNEREQRALRGRAVALVPQSPAAALNPALSLQAHFDETWRAHAPRGAAQDARVQHLLRRVDLPDDAAFLKRRPAQISIGQAQRILIALALLHRPALLIADEPTSALDVCTQQQIVRLLHEVSREEHTTLLYVSHDLVSVVQLCERMLVMSSGRLVESIDLDAPQFAPVHAVTAGLLETLPAPPSIVRQRFRAAMESTSLTFERAWRAETESRPAVAVLSATA